MGERYSTTGRAVDERSAGDLDKLSESPFFSPGRLSGQNQYAHELMHFVKSLGITLLLNQLASSLHLVLGQTAPPRRDLPDPYVVPSVPLGSIVTRGASPASWCGRGRVGGVT